MAKSLVRIKNPAQPSQHFTSMKAATRYVAKGRARWTKEGALEFIEEDHRHNSAVNLVLAQCEKNRGYDNRGRLSLKEISNLPVVAAHKLITIPSRRGPGTLRQAA